MKVCGITAEYNPLHNGHVYHISETRERSGCDAVAVAMSGCFVQRGEPAVADKWTRTAIALRSGADIVLEIPVLFCLGNSSQYASASVRILESFGCGSISFGSESGDSETLKKVASFLRSERERLDEGISALSKEGISYPAARVAVYESLRREDVSASLENTYEDMEETESELNKELAVLNSPNDILAVEYLREMTSTIPVVIKREGGGYNDLKPGRDEYPSAAAVRELLRKGMDISGLVPDECRAELEKSRLTFAGEWALPLRYAVMNLEESVIEDAPSGGEGLGRLLKESVMSCESLEEIIGFVKSKRYTYTRISRLCMQTVLGITRSKYPVSEPQYIRVLGFNGKGRELLAELKKSGKTGLPVITNINKETGLLNENGRKLLSLDVHASDIYNLVTGRQTDEFSDHRMKPVMAQ